jgi:uncharacterized protein YaiI (UPF0178 family)
VRLLVDGDASGRRDIILDLAEEFDVEVHWACNIFQKAPVQEPGRNYRLFSYIADNERDAADLKLMNLASRGDLLITSDLGLAVVCTSKGCAALSPRGLWFREEDLARMMEFRHLRAKAKRRGEFVGGGPKKAKLWDEERFENELRRALEGGRDPS